MKKTLSVLCLAPALMLGTSAMALEVKDILKTYSDIAHAGYEDSVTTAKALDAALEKLVSEPTEDNLVAAKAAW